MFNQHGWKVVLATAALLAAQCGPGPGNPTADSSLPNPASEFCEAHGYQLEIVTQANGSQSGECIFPDGRRCEEWAYYRGECQAPTLPPQTPPEPTTTPPAASPADFEGWATHRQTTYGFAIQVPPGWIVEPAPASDALLGGHLLEVHPADDADGASLRVTFRRRGEDTLLWPTGVGQGEFVLGDSIEVAGGPAVIQLLRCPTGQITSMWFHQSQTDANLQRGDLEFGFLFSAASSHCAPGRSLEGDLARTGELMVQSLTIE